MNTKIISKFCNKISYKFNNDNLLDEALTHPSLTKENQAKHNYQRLEFLGDKVLSLVISTFLMDKYQDEDEGALSKRHAALVSGETLSKIALDIELQNFLQISKGEENLGGKTNKRNLENALEAIIGAIYLDSNYENAKIFILQFWKFYLQQNIEPPIDVISKLQEIVQSASKELPQYEFEKIGGSDHNPIFTAKLRINHLNLEFEAKGSSKKEAQKEVAKLALKEVLV